MPDDPIRTVKGQCPNCNGERNAHIRAEHSHHWHIPDDGDQGDDTYRVLECAGCSTFFFQVASESTYSTEVRYIEELNDYHETMKTEFTHYPPKIIRSKPHWMPIVQAQDEVLDRLLDELYSSLNIDLSILPAIGARTVFDRAAEKLGVNPSLIFEKKLDALVDLGKIGVEERAILDILVQAGSAAAHRGWAPRAADVITMMDVAETFLKTHFYLKYHMQQMGQRVPPKPQRPPRPRGGGTPPTPPDAAPPDAVPSAPDGN